MKLTHSLVVALALLGLSWGQESRPTNEQIRAQVKNLDNESFELRTKAMETLRAAGEDARTELEAAKGNQSLEVRTRAESLLKELDARKAGAPRKSVEVRPVAPDDEDRVTAQPRKRDGQPRVEDFQDPRGYAEALRKWMSEQMDRDARFPHWVFPDDKDLFKDFGKDFVIVQPNDVRAGGTTIITRQSNGETVTFKSGADGVVLQITRKNEAGETVVDKYTAKDVDELKANHPDVWEKYKPTEGTITIRRSWEFPGAPGVQVLPGTPQPLSPLIQTVAGPRLGVTPSAVPPVLDKQLKLKGEGVVIDSVEPGSLASRMGIQELDVLLQLNGKVIRERGDISRALSQKDAPATCTAKVVREGAVIELSGTREGPR